MSFSKLKESSEKKVASVDIKDTETAGLSEKIMRDLNNPRSKAAQKVNQAALEAWGVHIKVEEGKLVMVTAKDQGR